MVSAPTPRHHAPGGEVQGNQTTSVGGTQPAQLSLWPTPVKRGPGWYPAMLAHDKLAEAA